MWCILVFEGVQFIQREIWFREAGRKPVVLAHREARRRRIESTHTEEVTPVNKRVSSRSWRREGRIHANVVVVVVDGRLVGISWRKGRRGRDKERWLLLNTCGRGDVVAVVDVTVLRARIELEVVVVLRGCRSGSARIEILDSKKKVTVFHGLLGSC